MIEEIQNGKNIGLCDELFSDDFVNHTPPHGISANRDGMRKLFSRVHAGYGRITEHWSVVDRLDLCQQLDLIKRG